MNHTFENKETSIDQLFTGNKAKELFRHLQYMQDELQLLSRDVAANHQAKEKDRRRVH
jgi:hypothetical protein